MKQLWWVGSLVVWALVVLSNVESSASTAVERSSNGGGGGGSGSSGAQNRSGGGRGMFREGRNLRRSHRSKFPLKAEDARRKSKRVSECRLGKNVHEIGDAWNPDLGEPFGIMHCIECSCEPVQKKRRIVGRIRCRNVKSDCPKLECGDAVSVPGQCCKVCPDTLKNNSDKGNSDSTDDMDGNENNNKEYAALLTPRSSALIKSSTGLGEPMTGGLGAGRFVFLHKSLYYSFVHNSGIPRPKYIQFVDPEGNVVEEQEVTSNNYQAETKKVCGVWKKIPRVYRKLLKEERLYAALVTEKIGTDNDRFLAGRVAKQRYVVNELYSSLLEPATQVGSGGMAVITVSPATGSIYLSINFNGDFVEDRDISIAVRIADASGAGIEEAVTLPKILYESNSIEVRTILEYTQLQSLSRGSLFIVVYSPKNPQFKLIGFIQARHTCDIFDTVLSPEDTEASKSGLAWVYPLPDGSWAYNFQLPDDHATNPVMSVKLETGRKVLEELPIKPKNNSSREVVSGMTARYYQLLYEGNIYLHVVTQRASMRGRLVYRGFGDAQLSDAPLKLEPSTGISSDLKTQGLLWVGVDSDCGLNYQMTLSERPQSDLMRLELMEMPGLQKQGVPVRSYVLDDFEASEHEGTFTELVKNTFAHIKAGDVVFKVVRVNDSSILASSVLRHIRVPSSCTASLSENILNPDYTLEPEDDVSMTPTTNKCFYDGQLREEYSQWTPVNDTCQMCTCYKGQAKCEAVVCPRVDCVNPVLLTGECCRSCLNTHTSPVTHERGCNVEGDRFHPAGSTWHPYMPPNGFMVCTTCSCNENSLTVECTREKCPVLNCAPEEAVYPRPLSCCKVCPPKKEIDPDTIADDVAAWEVTKRGPSEKEVLDAGGCKFRNELRTNGEEWTPRLEPFGFTPCIVCSCRNGETKCAKKKCPSLTCGVTEKLDGDCCPRCVDPATKTSKSSPAFLSGNSNVRQRGKAPSKQRPKPTPP